MTLTSNGHSTKDTTTDTTAPGATNGDSTAAAAPLLWMQGARAALGPFTRELAELYWQWENEPAVIVGMGRQTPESLEARLAGYDAQARSMGTIPRFTIYDLTRPGAPVPVGTSALRIDHYVRTAEFIILLGEDGRGRNLAAEATRLTLNYAFTISALRSVWLKVLEPNTGAVAAYEKAGFAHVGRLRRAGYWRGAEADELIMDVVADAHLATG